MNDVEALLRQRLTAQAEEVLADPAFRERLMGAAATDLDRPRRIRHAFAVGAAVAAAIALAVILTLWSGKDSVVEPAPPLPTPTTEPAPLVVAQRGPRALEGINVLIVDPESSGVRNREVALDGSQRTVDGQAWSPDGTRLAWERQNTDGTSDIYLGDADGGDAEVFGTCAGCILGSPSWSPDGSSVVYTRSLRGAASLVVAAVADGRVAEVVRVRAGWVAADPSFSRDSSRLVYGREPAARADDPSLGTEILVVDLATHQETVLASDGWPMGPVWSPDGSEVMFMAGNPEPLEHRGQPENLFVVGADGLGLRQFTHQGRDEEWVGFPDWSAGCTLATLIEPDQFWFTGIVSADGEVVALTEDGNPAYGVGPRLAPGGTC